MQTKLHYPLPGYLLLVSTMMINYHLCSSPYNNFIRTNRISLWYSFEGFTSLHI